MDCPSCGAPPATADAAFCAGCGAKLVRPAVEKRRRSFPRAWILPVVVLALVTWWANRNRGYDLLVTNGRYAIEGKEWERAVGCFSDAIALRPNETALHLDLAYALLRLERLDDAASSYERAIALDAGSCEAWRGLGWTRRRQGRMDDAAQAFVEAIRLRPEHYAVYFELAAAYTALGRVDDAVEVYRRHAAARLRENAWGGLFGEGDLSGEMIEGYMTSSERILKLLPDDPEAHYYVALALLERDGRPGDEVRAHLAALARQTDVPRALELAAKLETEMERVR